MRSLRVMAAGAIAWLSLTLAGGLVLNVLLLGTARHGLSVGETFLMGMAVSASIVTLVAVVAGILLLGFIAVRRLVKG